MMVGDTTPKATLHSDFHMAGLRVQRRGDQIHVFGLPREPARPHIEGCFFDTAEASDEIPEGTNPTTIMDLLVLHFEPEEERKPV